MREVNQAGEGVRVVLHLYKQGIPLCALINQQMSALAAKFPQVKDFAVRDTAAAAAAAAVVVVVVPVPERSFFCH